MSEQVCLRFNGADGKEMTSNSVLVVGAGDSSIHRSCSYGAMALPYGCVWRAQDLCLEVTGKALVYEAIRGSTTLGLFRYTRDFLSSLKRRTGVVLSRLLPKVSFFDSTPVLLSHGD